MSDGYFIDKHAQRGNGTAATKARWLQEDWRVKLDLVLGKADDLSAYHDCLAGARSEGSRMTPGEKNAARELSRNPR